MFHRGPENPASELVGSVSLDPYGMQVHSLRRRDSILGNPKVGPIPNFTRLSLADVEGN